MVKGRISGLKGMLKPGMVVFKRTPNKMADTCEEMEQEREQQQQQQQHLDTSREDELMPPAETDPELMSPREQSRTDIPGGDERVLVCEEKKNNGGSKKRLGRGRRSKSRSRRSSRSRSRSRSRSGISVTSEVPTGEADEDEIMEVIYGDFGKATDTMTTRTHHTKFDILEHDDVMIRIVLSTVSHTDCDIRRGVSHIRPDLPHIPGRDLVGVVVKTGSHVRSLMIGDRVASLLPSGGGNASHITVKSSRAFKIPADVSNEGAVCAVSTYMTAYQALYRARPCGAKETLEGKSVLITDGCGPVGLALVQLALRARVRTVYAVGEEEKHSFLRDMGAVPLLSGSEHWLSTVRGNIDIVVDGDCEDGYSSPWCALNSSGHLVCIGMKSIMKGEPGIFGPATSSMWANAKGKLMTRTFFYDVCESFRTDRHIFMHDLEYLFRLLAKNKIVPVVADRIPFQDIISAHQTIDTEGEKCGVIICYSHNKRS